MPHDDDENQRIDEELPGSVPDRRASRRAFLAASGALTLGSTLGVGAMSAAADATAPANMDEFRAAVEEALAQADSVIEDGPYEPTWDSLDGVDEVPEWFRDAKFGVYFHWGLYSVPAFETEWYPKWMYEVDREGWGEDVYEYHVENYGEPDEFPYQDFAPEFTAEEYDPEEWADLFESAGARFAGPVAEHHDGWANWDSAINPYNASDMGPNRDLVGELESSIRDRGMKFVTTFHHGRPAKPRPDYEDQYYAGAYEHFPSVTKGYPNRIMYRNMGLDLRWDMWFAKLVDSIERYEPDLVWHDSIHNPPEAVKQRYVAYNYNRAAAEDRPIAITQKMNALPQGVSITDYENDRPWLREDPPWLTDTTLSTGGAWSYTEDQEYKSVERVVKVLVDIVSKNGQMLLNLGPRANGTIPEAQRDRLHGIGDWLETNGEAIYETRPWEIYGTGPHFGEGYDAQDVRYTQSKDGESVYAIVMGRPEDCAITLSGTYVEDGGGPPGSAGPPEQSNAPEGTGPPDHAGSGEVTLLGHGSVPFCVDPTNHLRVKIPHDLDLDQSDDLPIVLELSGFELRGITADYTFSSSDIHVVRAEEDLHEITVTVYNLARGEAPATTVRVENASTGETIGTADVEAMSPYGNTEATVEWDTSEFEDGTTQKVRAVVDPAEEVAEQDESNNSATTTVELPAYPYDLTPASVSVSSMDPGSTATLTATVENVGTEEAPASAVRLFDVTGEERTTLTTLDVPTVAAGSSVEVSYQWDISEFEVGTTRQVEAVVDPEDALFERVESNNASDPATVRLFGSLPEGYETYASTAAVFGTWNDHLAISANGIDIWEDNDEYGALYRPSQTVDDDVTATVKVVDQENTNDWAKAGLMLRNDVTAAGESTGYAALMVTPENGIEFEWDSNADGNVDSASNAGETSYPIWLRLARDGTTVTASYSTDGESWTEVGSAELTGADPEQNVAMFSLSHTEGTLGLAEFDEFDVTT